MRSVAGVLTDIEGTTTPIAFVRDTLFPFSRDRLARFIDRNVGEPAVLTELEAVRRAAPGADPVGTLLGWIDADVKATPLKALQGMIWREGYATGELKGVLYPDVAPCLRRWREAGLRLLVFSSGSVEAQRQIFGCSMAGDLVPLFAGFFDTRIGAKREASSYDRIAIAAGIPAPELLFLSDVEAELDAAATAGLRTCQMVRGADGTEASPGHATATDFLMVERQFRLAN